MNLAYAMEVYQKDAEFRGYIDALIIMSYNLYWEHNIPKEVLIDSITKTVGDEIAEYMVSLIMSDNTTFLK